MLAAAVRPRAGTISDRRRLLAWTLIAVPLEVAVTLHLLLRLTPIVDEAMFAAGAVAFAVGAFLVLGREEDTGPRAWDEPEPPWWPEFERRFHLYSRRQASSSRDRIPVP